MVGLSLRLSLASLLEYPSPGDELTDMLLGVPLGLWFGSDVVWEVGIYCVPPYGYFITSKINSVRYCQLMELLTLSLSPTWFIPHFGGR